MARSLYLDLDDLSWSSDSRYFAVSASWYVGSEPRNGIAVGTPSGAIIKMIPTGRAAPSAPTWSPREPEFAYVSSLELGDRRSGLFIYDAVTGRQEAIMRHPPPAWWVAWSPQGDWILLDDDGTGGGDGRWLFVSRDGSRTVTHPWLGMFPRWASPGTDLHYVFC